MKCKTIIFSLTLSPLVILMISILVSCSSLSFSYIGLTVPENNLIYLKNEGTHEGLYQTGDITVNYTYSKNEGRLKISGLINFDNSLKYNFSRIDYFDLWIHFVNSENKIIKNISVSPITFFNEIEATPFEKILELPPDTKAIVFSYSGRVSDGGSSSKDEVGGGGSSWKFWKTPQG